MNLATSNYPAFKTTLPDWWPIYLGMLVLYVPTLHNLLNGLWRTEAQMHGPIILALGLWLIYRNWPRMQQNRHPVSSITGWTLFFISLLLYIIGRSQQIIQFEIGSIIWMIMALLLIKQGTQSLRAMWFPVFFLIFMIPLPGTIVIMLTMPMKMAVSYVAENLLYWSGYPIARSGVILHIGQYHLLVADACAGLQTLLTLEALGLFYLNVVQHNSAIRNISLACLIIPISFVANVLRVLTLTLITYYFGEQAGQGFLHQFSGLVLFLSALVLIITFDSLIQYWIKTRHPERADQKC